MHPFLRPFTKSKKLDGNTGSDKGWAALSKEVDMFIVESDEEEADDDDDNVSAASIGSSEDGEEAGVRIEKVDTDFDADRVTRDTSIVDEFDNINKCTSDALDSEIDLPPLSVEDWREACMLLSKVSFIYLFISNLSLF
jgi:hypothetical protein